MISTAVKAAAVARVCRAAVITPTIVATTSIAAAMETATSSVKATAAVSSPLGESELRGKTKCQEQNCTTESFPSDRVFHRYAPPRCVRVELNMTY
jgi:hypothetical protein